MAALALFAAGVVFTMISAATTTTVILVRHAEKELGTIADPPLSDEGARRAQRLAELLAVPDEGGKIAGIYVTDTRRTQQTANPLATRLQLRTVALPATDVSEIAARALREFRGKRVLIVGHSNTVPELVHELSSQRVPAIADDDFGNVYIVSVPSIGTANVLRMRY